jgi:hypothetical protein
MKREPFSLPFNHPHLGVSYIEKRIRGVGRMEQIPKVRETSKMKCIMLNVDFTGNLSKIG